MAHVLSRYGVKIHGNRCKCPIAEHKRKDMSCTIYKDALFCGSCQKKYSIFDIVMHFESCNYATAFKNLGGDVEMTDERKAKIEEVKRLANRKLQAEKDYWNNLNRICDLIKVCELQMKLLPKFSLKWCEYYHLWQLNCWKWEELFKKDKGNL